ncbi:MAG: ChaN family lipoprotein [Alphaproteobacteria bacterium]|nr:ChaN family lipoprotein [Alphaproteobacteria bacterium]
MKYTLTILFFAFLTSGPTMAATGKIWDVAGRHIISEKKLLNILIRSRNVLIGVRTDNPGDHRRAAEIITGLADAGDNPAILLGTIERDKQNAFAIFRDRYRGSPKIYDATGLDMLLEWSASSPLDWAVVRPVFDVAMMRKLSLRAAAFSRYEVGRLYRNGSAGLPDDVKGALLPLLASPLPKKLTARLTAEIHAAYCVDLPTTVTTRLIRIDRAQSGLFAVMMAQAAKKPGSKPTVLISSQKYIVADSGVPRYLKRLAVPGQTVSLLFAAPGQRPRPKVDYIWYSGKISRPAPCRFLQRDQP